MIDKNNSYLTRRRFLTIATGTAIGFSIPYIRDVNSVVEAQMIWKNYSYLLGLTLAGGLGLTAYIGFNRYKQSKLAAVNFGFEVQNPNSFHANINFVSYILRYNYQVRAYQVITGKPVNASVAPRAIWSYGYGWSGQGYAAPLYLQIVSGDNSQTAQFY